MASALDKLIDISGSEISSGALESSSSEDATMLSDCIWRKKNGFYAFNNSLLVRPCTSHSSILSAFDWNQKKVWKETYQFNLSRILFFAENVFGEQYGICGGRIYFLDPETGSVECISDSLEDWANYILSNIDFTTGRLLGQEWQNANRPLMAAERLLPMRPFVLQGSFLIENLVSKRDVEGMRVRAVLSNKIASLPDGADIEFHID